MQKQEIRYAVEHEFGNVFVNGEQDMRRLVERVARSTRVTVDDMIESGSLKFGEPGDTPVRLRVVVEVVE